MITIKDVALRAGVSISTVSRTLTGNVPVSRETRERVMEAIRELHYQPNLIAKGLKEGRTNTIGLVIPNIRNPFFPAVARGVEDYAKKNGLLLVLCNTDEDEQKEITYIEQLKQRFVDGLILVTSSKEGTHIKSLKEAGFPVVLLVRNVPSAGVDCIVVDNRAGACEMVKHLIGCGHRDIAMINGDLDIELYEQRYLGFQDAMQECGIPINPEMVRCSGGTVQEAYECTMGILEEGIRPTAIFASSDPKAIGAIRAVKDFGFRVPKDISVAGFDDIDISAYMDPPLTTYAQPVYEMGAMAVKRLLKLIEADNGILPDKQVIQGNIIMRKSVSELPVKKLMKGN